MHSRYAIPVIQKILESKAVSIHCVMWHCCIVIFSCPIILSYQVCKILIMLFTNLRLYNYICIRMTVHVPMDNEAHGVGLETCVGKSFEARGLCIPEVVLMHCQVYWV